MSAKGRSLRLATLAGVMFAAVVAVGADWFEDFDLRGQELWVSHWVTATPEVRASDWERFYTEAVEDLRPGQVTEFVIHVGYDDAEMQATTVGHDDWGSAWRQRDLDFFTSRRFRRLLEKHDVRLVTWREIGALMKGE